MSSSGRANAVFKVLLPHEPPHASHGDDNNDTEHDERDFLPTLVAGVPNMSLEFETAVNANEDREQSSNNTMLQSSIRREAAALLWDGRGRMMVLLGMLYVIYSYN